MRILVTGAAGFIGYHFVRKVFFEMPDAEVVGLDNLNDYYDPALKRWRINQLDGQKGWNFVEGDISDKMFVEQMFSTGRFDIVVNLAAQAGVRNSIFNPDTFIASNLIGFYNILEACRHFPVRHLVFASSSSVYGDNGNLPFSTDDKADNPVSLYAATKRCDELMARAYSNLYGIKTTGIRFFSVYGPAGRPDMAYFSFTDRFRSGDNVELFNYGECKRDFTYIDDAAEGLLKVMLRPSMPLYKIYNIGSGAPVSLSEFTNALQEELVRVGIVPPDFDFNAHKKLAPMQIGDVLETYADISGLSKDFGYQPDTPLREGLRKFVEWYKDYYLS